MKPEISILISSFEREKLFKRALFSIAKNKPSLPFEVIVADETEDDRILKELDNFNASFLWKYIKINIREFQAKTGLKKYHNNPSHSNNVAFKHSTGNLVFLMGNECIIWQDALNKMVEEGKKRHHDNWINFSTTYDFPIKLQELIDDYGANITKEMVAFCGQWPLQSTEYKSDVTNYLSLCPKTVWARLNGYDERYVAGIACEDSDFIRRARTLLGFETIRSGAISLHQAHNGKTRYYEPTERGMTQERWDEGVKINREIYHQWSGYTENRQSWPIGTYGIQEVVEHGY